MLNQKGEIELEMYLKLTSCIPVIGCSCNVFLGLASITQQSVRPVVDMVFVVIKYLKIRVGDQAQ